jgi:phage tail protein X
MLEASVASEPAEFQFDHPNRTSHSDQPVPLGGVPRALREAAEMSGLDPIAELYNEALRYATEGHLRLARERLQMLLCMKPDDGESRLMLAKVFVAGQKWKDAIAALDEAQSCGQIIPMPLRRAVEDHLRADQAAVDEHRDATRAREQGEIKALRQEARRLRSENAQHIGRGSELEREAKRWAWTTAGVSAFASVFLFASILFGGSDAPEADALSPDSTPAVADAAEPTTDEPKQTTPEADTSPTGLATSAANALAATASLDGTALEVEVSGSAAKVAGSVTSHRQRRTAEDVLNGISGISSVDASSVVLTARTKGTAHEIKRGDTLSHVAYEYYGERGMTKNILKANRGLKASSMQIGQLVKIPAVD